MKRRSFLKHLGLAAPMASAARNLSDRRPDITFRYPSVNTLEDVKTIEGETLVRIKYTSKNKRAPKLNTGQISVNNAELMAITSHDLESPDDHFDPTDRSYRILADVNHADILMLRLRQVSEQSSIRINQEIAFRLTDLLKKGYLQFEQGETQIDVNFLLDKEIGEIELQQLEITSNPDHFTFHVFADPQGGDPEHPANHRTRMKIHNAFIEDSIILANALPERPLFTLILGDIVDSQGEEENFQVMHELLSRLDSPVLYELGNHESRYAAKFEPGYDMSALQNFFNAQKKMNGMEKILYSFNAGKWHFVVWPDPLRSFFWDNHPHYFEWLEKDLEKHKDRPTFVFQHVPVHPIGISPFQGYLDFTSIRKKFVDIVTRYGNVRYVLSGHIHIPVKSSLKTAHHIRGTNFITLPAAGYRPRGFGEQDYFGGPTQGIAIVRIEGENATVTFKTVMEEELTYPDPLPELDLERYNLWFNEKWEIEAKSAIRNGNFSKGLQGWSPEYIYQEDDNPSVICTSRSIDGRNALYLYNRIRGYQAPGQDRLPQTINRISQAVQVQTGTTPVLNFQVKLDRDHCDLQGYCGGYLWIEGYEGSFRQCNLVYSMGMAFSNPIDKGTKKIHDVHHFDLPAGFDWQQVSINIKDDFNMNESQRQFDDLNIDRLVFTLGVWTLNEGTSQPFAFYSTDFKFHQASPGFGEKSTVQGEPLHPKSQDKIWWRGKHMPFIHLAGEHRYHLETVNKTLFEKEFERFKK